MCKKSKGIIKFIIACGVVVSAVCAVFAVLYRMHSKLKAADENECAEGEVCNGECEGCNICADAANDTEDEDEIPENEADPEETDTKE